MFSEALDFDYLVGVYICLILLDFFLAIPVTLALDSRTSCHKLAQNIFRPISLYLGVLGSVNLLLGLLGLVPFVLHLINRSEVVNFSPLDLMPLIANLCFLAGSFVCFFEMFRRVRVKQAQ